VIGLDSKNNNHVKLLMSAACVDAVYLPGQSRLASRPDIQTDLLDLLSSYVGNLQKMLDLCYRIGSEFDIIFNAKKSSLFVVGKSCCSTVGSLRIGSEEIVWSQNLKYLGFQFKSGKWLQTVLDVSMRPFFSCC